ncbi:mandelate racemase/muconate lactonizing enzyme family protein [Vannielia litorea]|uniref:mandelate racemase/muconate lactonizing enzyme family protein n=1 Tax=Vannielia litorea TaxID=1217970 RepID=UPI001C970971|nr:enolase C-terminal domain-like protein [Vannielia litorea]MBY6048982.1 mandelate racemase/muconate lactonizing enzyme family protein [Vannielia litorea]MBY6076396.1 mandelate racemase/muconate lactonizing enzyme family protein [Vannielia litorea]
MTGEGDHKISEIKVFPLVQRLPQPTRTSWGTYDSVSILLVEVRTASGLSGVGEALARFAPQGYAELIESALAPRLIGQDATAISARWADMRRALSGRAGGMLIEAISAVDIALWDILGKAANMPIWQLLGGVGRSHVPVYGASVRWGDDAQADADVDAMLSRGLTDMKVKIGGPVDKACARIARVRARAGEAITLTADSNWAYTLDEAELVARALEANNYAWFEEPLRPEDEAGYRSLHRRSRVPLAAGESNFTLDQAMPLIRDRVLSVLQPNVTRSGGITETRRMAELAAMHDVAYAPHVGMSGIICEVASLHLGAAMPNTRTMECAANPNLFRDGLADIAPGHARIENGSVAVPTGPGLGLTLDWDAVKELAA